MINIGGDDTLCYLMFDKNINAISLNEFNSAMEKGYLDIHKKVLMGIQIHISNSYLEVNAVDCQNDEAKIKITKSHNIKIPLNIYEESVNNYMNQLISIFDESIPMKLLSITVKLIINDDNEILVSIFDKCIFSSFSKKRIIRTASVTRVRTKQICPNFSRINISIGIKDNEELKSKNADSMIGGKVKIMNKTISRRFPKSPIIFKFPIIKSLEITQKTLYKFDKKITKSKQISINIPKVESLINSRSNKVKAIEPINNIATPKIELRKSPKLIPKKNIRINPSKECKEYKFSRGLKPNISSAMWRLYININKGSHPFT